MAFRRRRVAWHRMFRWLLLPVSNATRLLLLIATLGVVAWYFMAIRTLDQAAPKYSALAEVQFEVAPGESRFIGRRDLGQAPSGRSAEPRHIAFHHRADGQLELRNIAEEKRLDVFFRHGATSVYSDRFEIPEETAGYVEIEIGNEIIRLARDKRDRIKIVTDGPSGPMTTRVTGIGGVQPPSQNPLNWCSPETGWFHRNLWWPIQFLSRASPLAKGGGRRIANLGGPDTCRLESGVAQVALPLLDPELEFGIRRFRDKVGIRMYVHPVRLPSNIPVTIRRIKNGKLDYQPKQFDRPEWAITATSTDAAAQAGLANGFTAGSTRYSIVARSSPSGRNWIVTLSPRSKEPYFKTAECGTLFGIWPPDSVPAEDTLLLQDCPGPSRAENADLNFSAVRVASPISRLYLTGEMRYLADPTLPTGFDYGRRVLTSGELGLKLGLVLLAIYLIWRSASRPGSASSLWGTARRATAGLAISLLLISFAAQAMPFVASRLPFGAQAWQALDKSWLAWVMLHANLALFCLAAFSAFLDKEGGYRAQLFQLIVFVMVLIGAATLFSLSAEGGNSDWERFFIKQKVFVLDVLPAYWIALSLGSALDTRNAFGAMIVGRKSVFSLFRVVSVLMALIFFVWLFVGTQQGLLGFQPVELGKFVVIVAFAGVLSRWALQARMMSSIHVQEAVLGLGIVVFVAAVLGVPVLKSDFSPVIIIVFSLLGTAVIAGASTVWRIFKERKHDLALLRALPVRYLPRRAKKLDGSELKYPAFAAALFFTVLVAAVFAHNRVVPDGWSYLMSPDEQVQTARAALGDGRRTVHERLLGWADMRYDARHANEVPEGQTEAPLSISDRGLSYQGLRSRSAIAYASCGPSPAFSAFGRALAIEEGHPVLRSLAALCPELDAGNWREATDNCNTPDLTQPVEPHCIPVIQSDFIGTFLLARHGLVVGAFLTLLQFLFVVAGFLTYGALKRGMAREPVVLNARETIATMVLGATFLFLLQWVLSWGNAFVLLPVMGQPMTWVSAATSHHIFMALPAVLAILIGIRVAGAQQKTIPFRQRP